MEADKIITGADMMQEIDRQLATVRASKDGCGEVVIQVVKGRIVRVKTQLSMNVEEFQTNVES